MGDTYRLSISASSKLIFYGLYRFATGESKTSRKFITKKGHYKYPEMLSNLIDERTSKAS